MTYTYTDDRVTPFADRAEPVRDDDFVPVYARTRASKRSNGKIKTWMILAPIGAVVLGGVAAAMLMSGGDEVAEPALVEAAATAPVLPATASTAAPLAATPAPAEAAPTPVVREAAPVRAATPAPARRVEAVTPTPRISATPAPVATPTPASPTATLNVAPTAASTVAPAPTSAPATTPAPAIVVQPLG